MVLHRSILLAATLALGATISTVVGGLCAYAQSSERRVANVSLISPNSEETEPRVVAAFRDRLTELGWIEGKNVVIETHWAQGRPDRLHALAAAVAARNVDVIVIYSTPAAMAVKNATKTIPVVVAAMGDPIGTGLVETLARPGGNITGLSLGWGTGIGGKYLEILKETVPKLVTVAVITDVSNPVERRMTAELQDAAKPTHLRLRIIDVGSADALEPAFKIARREAQAVFVVPNALALAQRQRIAALAIRLRLPAIYGLRDYAEAGGFMSYGPDRIALFQRAAEYVHRILTGSRPADLPVELPTQYTFVVNLKTAHMLGITVPDSILLRADDLIR